VQGLTETISSLPAIGVVLAGCLALLGGTPASAQCRPPSFRSGQDYGGSFLVSIQPRDLTLDKLTCLARALRNRRRDRKSFSVLFFDSDEAAKYFQPPVEGYPPRWPKWAKELHAIYSFDADKHEESLDILPLGYNTGPSLVSRIDLPPSTPPRCRVEIQNRCLIAAAEKITYPREALKSRASGVIVLKAAIGRDGRVTGLRVAEANVQPSEEKARLANATLQDLKGWRFDAAGHNDPIQITYAFAIDASLARGGVPEVHWVSPSRLEIRANPPE
jgi:TonB family protein